MPVKSVNPLAAAMVAAALLLSACSSSSSATSGATPQSPSASATIPAGIPLDGWQVFPWTCQTRYASSPQGDTTQFDHVSGLLVCVSKHTSTSISAEDQGFNAVMRALSAPDELGVYDCPMMHPMPPLLVVLAATPSSNYRVQVPNGICGASQPALQRAFRGAGVDIPRSVRTS